MNLSLADELAEAVVAAQKNEPQAAARLRVILSMATKELPLSVVVKAARLVAEELYTE